MTSFTCRVCGNVPLVVPNDPKPFAEVAAVYYKITDLQNVDESSLPKNVCQFCYGKLVEIDWFGKNCIASYGRMTTTYPYGSDHEQHNRTAFNMYPDEQRNSYSTNTIQQLEPLGHIMNYPNPQAHAEMVAPNSVLGTENVEFSQSPPKPSGASHSKSHLEKSRSTHSSDLTAIHNRLDQLGAKLDGHSAILHRIEMFMLNSSYSKPAEQQQPHNRDDFRLRSGENFDEFERMPKIVTKEQLTELDAKLSNPEYEAKFFRYIQSVYKLTGKREGFPFFKTVIRRLMAPTVLVCYSWKGNSRTKKGDQTAVVNDQNYSFKNMFPNIVRFIYRVVSAADFEYTSEDNEKAFSDYLRQKTTEIKRFLHSNGVQREACTRKRRRKMQPPAAADDGGSSAGQDQGQDQEIYGVNDTTDGDFSYDEETVSDNGDDGVDIKQEAYGSNDVV
ncbi:AAEL014257-PA [Aedes aegypti]|uniref:AAEL014257-PA n=2 Tax=Aedes aegypti TaxID=7159 RepID=A0A1S4G1V3_AEDAE|nr:uncharacterized protein LOC5563994 [Aedes aegypti]EAT33468.1 AAEL014257-PA [Aedes aegypti]